MHNYKPGDRIYVNGQKRAFKVKACDEKYVIATRPYNPQHTVEYFIIDTVEGIRGPDDRVFCEGYETVEQCEERLKQLQRGELGISWRRHVKWEGEHGLQEI